MENYDSSQCDEYDKIICRTLFSVIGTVKTYYKFRYRDLYAKRQVGILAEDEYIKQLRAGEYYEDTKRYYNSLCTERLEKLGFISNNDSFDRIYHFNQEIFDEMKKTKLEDLVPYIVEYLVPIREYEKLKEKLKNELHGELEEIEN